VSLKIEETQKCLNFMLRMSSRIVGRHFDNELRPLGLKATQFNILSVLTQKGASSITTISGILSMERSALARNLKPLELKGFVKLSPGKDKRVKIASVTAKGKKQLQKALPVWSKTQKELAKNLGAKEVKQLANITMKLRAFEQKK